MLSGNRNLWLANYKPPIHPKKRQDNLKKQIHTLTLISGILTLILIPVYISTNIGLFETLYITFGTTFYHLGMRLAVGRIYQKKFNNTINYKAKWFKVGNVEYRIYKKLRVNSWKKYLPTYESDFFNMRLRTYKQIAMSMCQAEMVHETIVLLSFLPVIISIWIGSIEIFLITSILAAIFDLTFVIIQRYNRPRILRLMETKKTETEISGVQNEPNKN